MFKNKDYLTAYVSSQDENWAYMNYYFNTDNLDFYHYSLTDGESDYGTGKAKKDYDDRTTDYAIEWLEKNVSDDSFFLYVNFQSAHDPYEMPEGNSYYEDKWIPLLPRGFQESSLVLNRYDNALLFMDKQVGRMMDVLEEKGVLNNTIVIITSDHGEDLESKHDKYGHGMTVYNEEIHVPLIMYIPGVEHEDIYNNVNQIDFFPTLFDLLGYSIPKEFQGKIMRERNLIIFYIQTFRYYIGLIDDNMKIMLDMQDEKVEVYNLTEDPDELNNLVNSINYSVYLDEAMAWHSCQMKYYENKLWEKGELAPKC